MTVSTETRKLPTWVAGILPVILLIVLVLLFLNTDPLSVFTDSAPPVEELTLQRMILDDEGFELHIINSGPDPVTIAQVLVDDAYWRFDIEDTELERLESGVLRVPYPWVEGEAHEIVVITNSGATFPFEVEVAVATPETDATQFRNYALLGFFIGIVPVVLGLMWYPFLRTIDRRWLNFALALTVGLLVFLAVDTILEALEIAAEVPGTFQGEPLVFLLTIVTLLAILAVGDAFNAGDSRLFLAYMIALGIGLHNLGEGLAVGAAFALGQISLGSFLVVGFTLHNITEGIGIAAPVASQRPRLYHFVLLALLAGGPAILGTWIGGFAFNPLWAVVFLSIGAGAILQVVYEVSRLILRDSQRRDVEPVSVLNLSGFVLGIAIMYFTAFLVA
ncbi:MAG: metal transporter [Chloroflexi bacterium]|nr:metal transporter [Chloroflexota bacterium]